MTNIPKRILATIDPKKLNKKNINRMIRIITGKEIFTMPNGKRVGFNMNLFLDHNRTVDVNKHQCGSTACVAGYADLLCDKASVPDFGGGDDRSDVTALEHYFNIPYWMAIQIAYPESRKYPRYEDIPAEAVAAQLRHLRDTGELLELI